MAWQVWWALVLGFVISAIVQAWVPRERIERSLASGAPRSVGVGRPALALRPRRAPTRRSRSPSRCFRRAPRRRPRSPSSSPPPTWCGSSAWCCGCCSAGSSRVGEFLGGIVMIVLMAATAAPVRLTAARGDRLADTPRRPTPAINTTSAGSALRLAPAADLGRAPGPTWPTTSAATGRCCGRRSPSASCSPASSAWSPTTSSRRSS